MAPDDPLAFLRRMRHEAFVPPHELGRVADPKALDESTGSLARLRIEISSDWPSPACPLDLLIDAPRRLSCARCEGGGCDRCGRSGALRAPEEPAARRFRARLPAGAARKLALRIPHPFGPQSHIEQLILEIHLAPKPSPGVTCITPTRHATSRPLVVALPLALIAIAAIIITLLSR